MPALLIRMSTPPCTSAQRFIRLLGVGDLAQVAAFEDGLDAVLLSASDGDQPVDLAGIAEAVDDQVAAALRQRPGHPEPDAAGGAGDQREFALQCLVCHVVTCGSPVRAEGCRSACRRGCVPTRLPAAAAACVGRRPNPADTIQADCSLRISCPASGMGLQEDHMQPRLESVQCLHPGGLHRMAYAEWGDPRQSRGGRVRPRPEPQRPRLRHARSRAGPDASRRVPRTSSGADARITCRITAAMSFRSTSPTASR